MGLSIDEAKRQRKQLLREIAREHKRKDREKLKALRLRIREVKTRRKEALHMVRTSCRKNRLTARQHAKVRIAALREEARQAAKRIRLEETIKARAACKARKEKVKAAAMSATAKRRHILEAERALQRELERLEGWAKRRHSRLERTAHEARQESDDEVRHNIPAELVPLFDRVRKHIKGSARESRTEALLRYAEENPGEVVEAQEELSQREIARMIREAHALEHSMRSPKRYRPSAAELAAIPF